LAKQSGIPCSIEPPIPTMIPAAHARALSAHFKTAEEYLRVVDSSLDGFEGVFHVSPAEVPAEQRARVRTLAAEILEGLRRIRHELGLEPLESSSLGIVRAYLSELWVSLAETHGRYLGGYGEMPPELAAYLDHRVGDLESQVNEIRAIIEEAFDRIESMLEQVRKPEGGPQPDASEISNLRMSVGRIRRRLQAAAERFKVNRTRPQWRQRLAAELSALWVVLENAMPRRMRGYGRELAAQDRADWEALIRDLLHEIEHMRRIVTPNNTV
jgi:hypothetical protein